MMDESRFQRLCQAQIEGVASMPEQKELRESLNGSEAARRSYTEQMRIHALLSWQHGRATGLLPEAVPAQKVNGWRICTRSLSVAAAAAVAMLSGIGWLWHSDERGGVRLEVVEASNVSFQVGEQLQRKEIDIVEGAFAFKLSSGVVVNVVGPVSLQLISPKHLRLLRGSLTADVGTMRRGFIVDTLEARVANLGTRFSVTAGKGNSTDVAVFEGSVEVYQPGAANRDKPDVTLKEGDAIRVEGLQRPRRLKLISLGNDALSLASSHAGDVVSAVSDNVAEDDFRSFYGLLSGAMGENAQIYTKGLNRRWHAMPAEPFPDELLGADIICTFSTDRHEPELEIHVTVAEPCDIYVMPDTRFPIPEWLQRDFTDTRIRLRSGTWNTLPTPDGIQEHAYVTHAIWRKRIATPGTVILGPTSRSQGRIWSAMYGIAVKKLP